MNPEFTTHNKPIFSIREAAKLLGVSIETLRRWDANKVLTAERTKGGQRRYRLENLEEKLSEDLYGQALLWVSKDYPEPPNETLHCPTRDIFEARLRIMEQELSIIPGLQKIFSLISSSAGEIGNNSFDHNLGNWTDLPGIFFGYNIKEKRIVLADRRQGILKTLQRVRPELSDDAEALHMAFSEIVTGRAPEQRGNGLKYVRIHVENGYFSITFRTGIAQLKLKAGEKLCDDVKMKRFKIPIIGCIALIEF